MSNLKAQSLFELVFIVTSMESPNRKRLKWCTFPTHHKAFSIHAKCTRSPSWESTNNEICLVYR